jgi:hypothetical protein
LVNKLRLVLRPDLKVGDILFDYFSQQVIVRQESFKESRGYLKEIKSEIRELEETLKYE